MFWKRRRLHIGIMITMIFWIVLLMASESVYAAQSEKIVNLEQGWAYSKAEVKPDQMDSVKWEALNQLSDSKLSEQNSETPVVSFRITLPNVDCVECVLSFERYIRSYVLYVDGHEVASSGGGATSQLLSLGKPDAIIDLPGTPKGKQLLLVENISHRSTPLYSPIYFGDKETIIRKQLSGERTQIIISMLVLMTGLISTMLYLSLKKDAAFLNLGLCATNIGLYMLSCSGMVHYFSNDMPFWDFLEYLTLYTMPLTTWYYFRNFVTSKPSLHWSLVAGNGGFILFSLLQQVRGIALFEYVGIQRVVFLVSLVFIIAELVRSARAGNREAKMVVAAFIITCLITMCKIIALFFNVDLTNLTSYAGGFFMLSQLFVMTDRFRRMNEELSIHSKNLERFNEVMEGEVHSRTKQVRTLMDNVAQGFLTVGPNLIVEKEFSKACIKLLGEEPAGRNIVDLLTRGDASKTEWLERMFRDVFETTEQFKIDMYVQLLPSEIVRDGRTLGISMEVVRSVNEKPEHLILMFNDLTKQRALEEKLKNEEKLMRMIVTVLSRSRDYADLVDDYHQFVDYDLPSLLKNVHSEMTPDVRVLRLVHTFKGNFAQMNSILLAAHLHEIEHTIKRGEHERLEEWAFRVSQFEWKQALQKEQQRMFEILPAHHWNDQKNAIPVPRNTLLHLRDYILDNLPNDLASSLVKEVERLYQKSFASLFEAVAENTSQLAERINKMIEPVTIEGGEWFVDLEPWYGWSKSLIHISRNQVDHGIEDPDIRIDTGKELYGKISISIAQDLNHVTIRFADDGAGINVDKLRKKLISNQMISVAQVATLPDHELYRYLFMDSVSTRDSVSELSGRGVGLAKVLEETEKLGGTIEVESVVGIGTTFIFCIPVRDGLPVAQQSHREIAS